MKRADMIWVAEHHDEQNRPLIVVEGVDTGQLAIGTVDYIEELIKSYRQHAADQLNVRPSLEASEAQPQA